MAAILDRGYARLFKDDYIFQATEGNHVTVHYPEMFLGPQQVFFFFLAILLKNNLIRATGIIFLGIFLA